MALIELQMDNINKFLELELEAYRIAAEINNAEGLIKVGRVLGKMLVELGEKEKGVKILKRSFEIGNSAGLPGTEEIKQLLVQQGETVFTP